MNASFAQAGVGEDLKAAVHGVALGVVALMCGYNVIACWVRPSRHLAFNALLYGSALEWERRQIAHHLRAWRDAE